MNTYSPVLRRGLASWDQKKLPIGELESRLDRIRKEMKARNISVLIVHGDAWDYGDLAYATHFSPMTREAVALVPLKGDPVLYVALGSRDIPFAKQLTWIEEVYPLLKLPEEISSRLEGWGSGSGSIGLVGIFESMRAAFYDEIRDSMEESQLISCTEWYRELRTCKSDKEVHLLKEAAGISDHCFEQLSQHPIHGLKEFEVAAKIDYLARCRGAEDCRVLLTSGTDSDRFLRPAGDRQIGSGERVLIYLALSCQRYWAVCGRTIPTASKRDRESVVLEETLDLYHKLLEDLRRGLHNEFSGTRIKKSFDAHMEKHHVKTSVTIKGIGLDREEMPCIDTLSPGPQSLVPGMFLSLALSQVGPGAGMFFSDPIFVRSGGCELISQSLPLCS